MISPSSTAAMLDALDTARTVHFAAWFLRPGPVLRALEGAARRGADVSVRVDGFRFGGTASMAAQSKAALEALKAAGAHARAVHCSDGDGPDFHMKAAVCDGVAYLDDCNWNMTGDSVLRDDAPGHVRAIREAAAWHDCAPVGALSLTKADALASEHAALRYVRGCREADVESEHLHTSVVTSALRKLAARGVRCRVLVSARAMAGDPQTRATARSLERCGIQVRSTQSSEKLAIVGGKRAWTGSADATSTFYDADEIDWSLSPARADAGILRTLRSHFNAHWRDSRPV